MLLSFNDQRGLYSPPAALLPGLPCFLIFGLCWKYSGILLSGYPSIAAHKFLGGERSKILAKGWGGSKILAKLGAGGWGEGGCLNEALTPSMF